MINGEILRTVTPKNQSAYKFKYKDEECHFIYEEIRFMKHVNKRVFLYPIDMFKPNNMIEL